MSSDKTKNSNRPSIHGLARLAALAGALTLLLTACSPGRFISEVNPLSTSEREALVALHDATGGAEWKNNARWLSDLHIGTWHGVQYYDQVRETTDPISGGTSRRTVEFVHTLDLKGNGLTGEISPKLHGLDNLRRLDLRGNRLTGEIPSELGRMDDLSHLYLGGNQLTGEIPSELGGMDGLYYLSLANNQLTGEIPSKLGDLGPRLRTLSLRGNQLTGEIPPELGGIRDLEVLDLRGNDLTGEIPAELDNPRNMIHLYLGGNRFTGCIPNTFKSVQYNDFLLLNLPFCDGSTLPGDITSRALIALFNSTGGYNWHDNTNWGSSRQTSSWFGVSNRAARNPRLVTILQLPGNNLTGQIPPELGNLGSLGALDLRGNNLTGQIPAELGNLRLNLLYLGGNRFTGCIPPVLQSVSISDLSKLGLPLCAGEALPPEETNPALLALYNDTGGDNWHDNTFWLTKQPLDQWFGVHTPSRGPDPRPVQSLRLSENNLTGQIPPDLGNLGSLGALDLRGNNLTGQIPAELGNLRLTTLDLRGNNLTGEIPPELGNLKSMRVLGLGGNNLTGEIPPELGNFYPVLRSLDLSGNNLTGEIPPELGRLSGPGGMTTLHLKGNRFTGCIPARLKRVKKNDLSELGLPFCKR